MPQQNPSELFEPPKLSVDKMPQLRALFERVASTCVDDLKDLLTTPIGCFLNQVDAGDSWDVVDGFENCIAALFYVSEWDVQVLIAIERRLLTAVIDVIFGGDGSEANTETERQLSKLELDLAKEVFSRTATSLTAALEPLSSVTLSFERIETQIEFTILGPQNVPCIYSQLLFQILDNGGRMFILLPRAPLLPLRKKLERGTLRESHAEDPIWTRRLQSRVANSNMKISAVLDAAPMTLAQISRLSIGQILQLDAISDSLITLQSASTPMFVCSLGQQEGYFTVRVDKPASPPKSLMENVLSGAVTEV